MARRTGWFHLHRSVVAVVAVGLAASLAGYAYSSSSVKRNNDVLLKQEAGQASVVLGSFLNQYAQGFLQLGGLVNANGGSQIAFAAAARQASQSAGGAPIALLHEGGGHFTVVSAVGTTHFPFGGSGDAPLITELADGKLHYPDVAGTTTQRFIEQIAGAPAVPAGYALYWELPTNPLISPNSIPGLPFSAFEAAVYLGSELPENLVFATTRDLPLNDERAVVPVAQLDGSSFPAARLSQGVGSARFPGTMFLVFKATASPSGRSAAAFPWILLFVGILASGAVALLLAMALRRRDEALGLVGEMKRKNAELDRAIKRQTEAEEGLRAAQRLEAVGQLAGGIAHDFNNLLHVILSYTGFIDDAIGLDSPLRPDVLEVQKAARRAAELTRQLLVFARGEAVRPDVLDANSVILDIERLLVHTLGEDVDLRIEPTEDPCHFVADLGEVNQVLMNLAINARDAMPRGGTLTIAVRQLMVGEDRAPGMGLGAGPHVRIDVTDTGIGMTRDVAARAFEPFFTTKETGRGTGLGLAMVYGIVARWQGFVSISSSPGRGTTVTLLFPLAPDDVAALTAAGESAPAAVKSLPVVPTGRAQSETVLLVEDQDGVRRSTARILQSAGYQVIEASDAAEAERLYNDHPVDLLLTDIVMPGGLSGKDLADRLHERNPDLPVVFVTGYGAENIAERGVLPAFVTLVEKPFTSEVLLNAIRSAFREAQHVS
ncbi:MAG: ATP-binding protein [Acidimicrobiales bacterium]